MSRLFIVAQEDDANSELKSFADEIKKVYSDIYNHINDCFNSQIKYTDEEGQHTKKVYAEDLIPVYSVIYDFAEKSITFNNIGINQTYSNECRKSINFSAKEKKEGESAEAILHLKVGLNNIFDNFKKSFR